MKLESRTGLMWINRPAVNRLRWIASPRVFAQPAVTRGCNGRSPAAWAGAMIRTISPSRANFGRCSACAVRSLSICGALDQADLMEFERIARHMQLAPNEALFTAGQAASSVHNLTAGVARLYKLLLCGCDRRRVGVPPFGGGLH